MRSDSDPDAVLWDSIIPALPFLGAAFWMRNTWLALPWLSIAGYAIYGIGCWLVVKWAVRTVRLSSWVPHRHAGHSLLAIAAAPILLVPAVVVNAFQSAFYFGLTLFVCQLLGLLGYFYLGWKVVALVPIAMFFAGGIVRLYAYCYSVIDDMDYPAGVIAVLSNLLWPLFLAWMLLQLVWYALGALLSGFWLILLGGFIGLFLGSGTGGMLFGAVVALIPLAFNVGAAGVAPTDVSGMDFGSPGGSTGFDFDSFSVNPANGLPMMGGMGGFDIHGNTFGTDFNDPQ